MALAKVISWHLNEDYHMCQLEDGSKHRIDLMIDGSFSGIDPQELVGKSIEFAYLQPWISLAHGAHVADEAKTGEPR
jgi:hypothetical protein